MTESLKRRIIWLHCAFWILVGSIVVLFTSFALLPPGPLPPGPWATLVAYVTTAVVCIMVAAKVAVAVTVYLVAKARGKLAILWAAISVLGGPIGDLIAYLVMVLERKPEQPQAIDTKPA